MSIPRIKENRVYKKELLLKSSRQDHLEEHEFLFSHTIYNEQDKVVEEYHYDSDGKLVQEYQFMYDQNGFLREEILKQEDGFVAEHKTYEPDEKNNILKEFRHYMDGSFDTIFYHYNAQGLLSKKEIIDPDGDKESTEEFEYENGLLTRFAILDADNEIVTEKKITYDEKGNPEEVFDFDGSEGTSVRKVLEYYPSGTKKETLIYNEADQLIEKVLMTENSEGRLVQVVEENRTKKNTITFDYDQAGNIIAQEETDRNGELVSKVNRVFDENNQLISTDVFIHGGGKGVSKNYTLRQEYIYF
jgi:YD repeat-containing protein